MSMSNTATATKDLVEEISVLKAQLKELSAAIEKDATNGIGGVISDVQSKSKAAIDEVLATAQSFLDDYSETAKEKTKDLLERSAKLRDDATESFVDSVMERPITTLAAVVGIGFVAGYLCRRT